MHENKDTILPVYDQKGKISGLSGGSLIVEKKGNLIFKARSTTKFIFQILIGIFLYSIILGSLMILKLDIPPYSHILMILILLCAVGIGVSITLYIMYPLIAPHIFDFHLGIFYTKPLSLYIHIISWDSIQIIPLSNIKTVQIIRIEKNGWNGICTIDQTSIKMQGGEQIGLITRKNALLSQIKEDAQKLATRLVVPVVDGGIITL